MKPEASDTALAPFSGPVNVSHRPDRGPRSGVGSAQMRTVEHGYWGMAIAACVALGATNVNAAELRCSQTAAGNVVATGNTLGLSKQLSANGPGIEDSIGDRWR